MKFLTILAISAVSWLPVMAAQADPDLPGSGADCSTATDLGDAVAGTVGAGDTEDWYRNNGAADQVILDNLAPMTTIRWDVYDSDCESTTGGTCAFQLQVPLSGSCDLTGRAERLAFGLFDGAVRPGGAVITLPAGASLRLAQSASEFGAPSAYALNRLTPELG